MGAVVIGIHCTSNSNCFAASITPDYFTNNILRVKKSTGVFVVSTVVSAVGFLYFVRYNRFVFDIYWQNPKPVCLTSPLFIPSLTCDFPPPGIRRQPPSDKNARYKKRSRGIYVHTRRVYKFRQSLSVESTGAPSVASRLTFTSFVYM